MDAHPNIYRFIPTIAHNDGCRRERILRRPWCGGLLVEKIPYCFRLSGCAGRVTIGNDKPSTENIHWDRPERHIEGLCRAPLKIRPADRGAPENPDVGIVRVHFLPVECDPRRSAGDRRLKRGCDVRVHFAREIEMHIENIRIGDRIGDIRCIGERACRCCGTLRLTRSRISAVRRI